MIKDFAIYLLPTFFKVGKRRRDLLSTDQIAADLLTLKALQEHVLRWCVKNKFLIEDPINDDNYIANGVGSELLNRMRSHVFTVDLKRLNTVPVHSETMLMLQDNVVEATTSRLMDLYVQICTELDPRWLNLYINKLISVLESIHPYDPDHIEWSKVFTDHPFIWLLWPIQQIMRAHSDPI